MHKYLIYLSLFMFLTANPVVAQTDPIDTLADRINAVVEPSRVGLEELRNMLENKETEEGQVAGLNQQKLRMIRGELQKIATGVNTQLESLNPEIIAMFVRFGRLPPLPESGEEAQEIALERKKITEAKGVVVLAIKNAEAISFGAASLAQKTSELERELFVSSLFEPHGLGVDTITTAALTMPGTIRRFIRVFMNWLFGVIQNNPIQLMVAFLPVVIIVGGVVRTTNMRKKSGKAENAKAGGANKEINAFFGSLLVPAIVAAAILYLPHVIISATGLYQFGLQNLIGTVITSVFGLYVATRLANAMLHPKSKNLRIVNVDDREAKKLSTLYIVGAAVIAIDAILSKKFLTFSSAVELTITKSLVVTLVVAGLIVAAAVTRSTKKIKGGVTRILGLIVAVVICSLAVTGFVSLSQFIANQIIITGSLLVIAWLAFNATSKLSDAGILKSTKVGKIVTKKFSLTDMKVDQIALAISIVTKILVVAALLPIIAIQWGYQKDQVAQWSTSAFTGFSVAGFNFSIGNIFVALVAFSIAVMVTKALQAWFDKKVFGRMSVDAGVQNSLKAGIGYVGYIVAALVGLSLIGLNLSNIALIAGALSLGIGFGLQNIVNNFVSGIIMLIERPIKVGDMIDVSGFQGYVKKINVRATELETFDRQSVIIPNSDMINSALGNWMHRDKNRRVIVSVGVAYGTDPEKVKNILYDIGKNHPSVMPSKEPFIYFSDFGASSLDFQLRVIIKNIDDTLVVENDLRYEIHKQFQKQNIEIPFPQRDVHIHQK